MWETPVLLLSKSFIVYMKIGWAHNLFINNAERSQDQDA